MLNLPPDCIRGRSFISEHTPHRRSRGASMYHMLDLLSWDARRFGPGVYAYNCTLCATVFFTKSRDD